MYTVSFISSIWKKFKCNLHRKFSIEITPNGSHCHRISQIKKLLSVELSRIKETAWEQLFLVLYSANTIMLSTCPTQISAYIWLNVCQRAAYQAYISPWFLQSSHITSDSIDARYFPQTLRTHRHKEAKNCIASTNVEIVFVCEMIRS